MAGSEMSERTVRALPELYALTPVERYPEMAMSLVRRLVDGDKADYTEIDLGTGDFRVLVDPEPSELAELADARQAVMHQHPVLGEFLRASDREPWLISDFLTRREFHRTPLYGEFFGPLCVEDQLTVAIGPCAAISVDRDRRTFSSDERRELDHLRPHLWRSYANAVSFSRALRTRGVDDGAESVGIERLTERQREILAEVAAGQTNAQIGLALDIGVGTVRKHLEHILRRLNVSTRTAAAVLYITATSETPDERWTASLPGMLTERGLA